MGQKTINLFLSGFILFGTVLGYHFRETSTLFDVRKAFFKDLEENFHDDSLLVVNTEFNLLSSTPEALESSGFSIEISKNDSLVFWNKELPSSGQQGKLFKQFKSGPYLYKFYFPFGNLDNSHSIKKEVLLFSGWFLGLFLLSVALLHWIRNSMYWTSFMKRHDRLWISMATLILFALPGFITGSKLFHTSFYFGTKYSQPNLSLDLWHFALALIILLYLSVLSQAEWFRSRVWNMGSSVRYLTGTFTMAFIIYFLAACAELFILKGKMVVNIEEAMNFGVSEFFFYGLSICYLFILVSLAKRLYSKTTSEIKGWEKSLYITLAILGITIIFILSGFKTNTIGIVLFLMVLFLLLDLYFEYFEINVSFLLSAVLVFGLFYSTLIYNVSLERYNQASYRNLDKVYKDATDDDLQLLKAINDTIVTSELFPSLSNLPWIGNLDVKDLKSYIGNQIPANAGLYIDNIYCYDKKGISLALNQIANKNRIESLIAESILISEHIYYSPIEKSAVLFYHIDNVAEPVNPVYMAIQFTIKSRPSLRFPYKSSIAIYKEGHLIKVLGSREGASYPPLLADLNQNQSHQIVGQKTHGDYVLISLAYKGFVARFLPLLTLFISLTGIMVLLLVLLNSFFHFIEDRYHLSFNMRKSLRSRFQTTITGLVLFSFVLIGGTTALYYQRLYNIKNTQSFEMLLDVLTKDIQTNFPETENAKEDGRLEKAFRALESVHDLPIAFYSSSGIKILTSLSYDNAPERLQISQIFKDNNLSNANMRVLSTQYQKNKVLIPVYDANQVVSGFFLTEDLQRSRGYAGLYDFLSTLLTLCVFLFLTALALSMIVTNPMTKSLKNLSSRLKDFKLGKDNEKLEWKNPDEIGALISNFNKMQIELNHSADLLSKTQRDLAWREMAKQVAHEIKNPLTPMKLSIQHMQNAASSDPDKTKVLIQRTSATILEQIENLTQIADEFSSFGTLPKASNDTIVLNEVVEHIHDLFRKREDMDIQMAEPMNDIHVFADKNQLVRILNNIVKNATQSIPEGKRGKIDIELSQNDQYAVIKVSDNGVGIPDEMKEKVFTPNFTTKSSGTGLGLAISANMIESMNGRLYFVSPNAKSGTDFFIELPLVRNSGLNEDENQIELD